MALLLLPALLWTALGGSDAAAQVCAGSVTCYCGVSMSCGGMTQGQVEGRCGRICADRQQRRSGPAFDFAAQQRAIDEQQRRMAERRKARIRQSRLQEQQQQKQRQEDFERDRDAAVSQLKGTSDNGPDLGAGGGPSGGNTAAFGLKGVDARDAGLRKAVAGPAPVFRTAFGKLTCAASVAKTEFALIRGPVFGSAEFQRVSFYAEQGRNALDGRPVQGGCDAVDKPLVFQQDLRAFRETYDDIQSLTLTQAWTKLQARQELPRLRHDVDDARAQLEVLEAQEPPAPQASTAAAVAPPESQLKLDDGKSGRSALEQAKAALRAAEEAEKQAQEAERKADEALSKLQTAEQKISAQPDKADALFDQMFADAKEKKTHD